MPPLELILVLTFSPRCSITFHILTSCGLNAMDSLQSPFNSLFEILSNIGFIKLMFVGIVFHSLPPQLPPGDSVILFPIKCLFLSTQGFLTWDERFASESMDGLKVCVSCVQNIKCLVYGYV